MKVGEYDCKMPEDYPASLAPFTACLRRAISPMLNAELVLDSSPSALPENRANLDMLGGAFEHELNRAAGSMAWKVKVDDSRISSGVLIFHPFPAT